MQSIFPNGAPLPLLLGVAAVFAYFCGCFNGAVIVSKYILRNDVRNFHITGKEFERRLDEVQITVNKNAIPNDPEKPFVTSGVRVGTPAVTSRGFKEPEMVQIAHWMGQTARDFDTCREQVRSEVDALCRKFPIYQ